MQIEVERDIYGNFLILFAWGEKYRLQPKKICPNTGGRFSSTAETISNEGLINLAASFENVENLLSHLREFFYVSQG